MSYPGRRLLVCVIVLVSPGIALGAAAGGIPGQVPARHDGHKIVIAPGGGDIVAVLEKIPHDVNPLGINAAHQRTKPYPLNFYRTFGATPSNIPELAQAEMF